MRRRYGVVQLLLRRPMRIRRQALNWPSWAVGAEVGGISNWNMAWNWTARCGSGIGGGDMTGAS